MIVLWNKRIFTNFQKINFFKVSLIFFKRKTLPWVHCVQCTPLGRAAKCANFFLNWTQKWTLFLKYNLTKFSIWLYLCNNFYTQKIILLQEDIQYTIYIIHMYYKVGLQYCFYCRTLSKPQPKMMMMRHWTSPAASAPTQVEALQSGTHVDSWKCFKLLPR